MSGKLLIVGDSFCSRYLQESKKIRKDDWLWKIPDYKYWFEYLGEKLNLDIINLSYNGAGNQQIFDNTLYALNTNDDIEFAVICWSEFDRVDLPYYFESGDRNAFHINLTNDEEIYKSIQERCRKYNNFFTEDKFFDTRCMIDKFINYSITVDNLFKYKNIKNIQAFSVQPYPDGTKKDRNPIAMLKTYIEHKLFDKLNDELFFKFPGTDALGGGNFYELYAPFYNKKSSEYVLNSEPSPLGEGWVVDQHPNAEGNKIIFDAVYRFMLDKY
tara:strand:- start:75 stop:887 length:813 start_codon:yes stop_codon:yes gene_type:complete